jgi:hypothetical protein
MKNIILPLAVILTAACCKKDDNNPSGAEEAKKIEQAVIGYKYRIESIKDQNGADASAQFPACIADDIYFFKDRGTVVITQGAIKCGQETVAEKNTSWAIGFDDAGVSALQVPVFLNGLNFYIVREFVRGLFSVNSSNGAVNLSFKVGADTYTIYLVQTL